MEGSESHVAKGGVGALRPMIQSTIGACLQVSGTDIMPEGSSETPLHRP